MINLLSFFNKKELFVLMAKDDAGDSNKSHKDAKDTKEIKICVNYFVCFASLWDN